MIDLYELLKSFLEGQKVRAWQGYGSLCLVHTCHSPIEIADTPSIIVPSGAGEGILDNPSLHNVDLFHLGNAIFSTARKKNQLPSACDLLFMNHTTGEFILAEMTHSNQRSIDGVENSPGVGKREKARQQLCLSIDCVERAGRWTIIPSKKTAIFFFRLKPQATGVAGRADRAFSMRPTQNVVTIFTDPHYPDWEFRSHPYPSPYRIS